jgi:hypothetical protein
MVNIKIEVQKRVKKPCRGRSRLDHFASAADLAETHSELVRYGVFIANVKGRLSWFKRDEGPELFRRPGAIRF